MDLVRQTELLSLFWQPVKEKEKPEFKTVKFRLEILTLCHILLVVNYGDY